jgi:predicted nucleic acid-binding protein
LKYLVDTNVLSEVRKPKGNPAVREKLAAINDDNLFLSVISIGEISRGIAKLDSGKQRQSLEEWMAQAEHYFADRILPVERDIAQLWGELTAKVAKAGRVLHTSDGLIAATALRHGLQLMTRNTSDFESTGVLLANPWEK